MANFTKDDLLGYYKWTAEAGDNPNYKDISDRIEVDKTEGYEVLHFCNRYLMLYGVHPTLTNFRRVEKLLKDPAASKIIMRNELYNFIAKNW